MPRLIAIAILWMCSAGYLYAQTAPSEFANIQVMKDVQAAELLPAMEAFNAALGVECNFCHVRGSEPGLASFAGDQKPMKAVARRMITMTADLKRTGVAVSCATCHAGEEVPLAAVPPIMEASRLRRVLDEDEREQRASAGSPAALQPDQRDPRAQQAQAPQPTPDEIFAKYERAIGGEAAIRKLNAKVATGVVVDEHGQRMPFVLTQKSSNQTTAVTTRPDGTMQRMICRGAEGWRILGADAAPIPPHQMPAVQLENQFLRDVTLRAQYTNAVTLPPDTIAGRTVRVVRADVAGTPFTDTLYFDVQTGLLSRRLTVQHTALGAIPQQTDYASYRAVDRVKVPFTIRRTGFAGSDNMKTYSFAKVQFNIPVNEDAFVAPAPAAAR